MKTKAKPGLYLVRQVDTHTLEILGLTDRRDELKSQIETLVAQGRAEAAEMTVLRPVEGISICPDGSVYFDDEEFISEQDIEEGIDIDDLH